MLSTGALLDTTEFQANFIEARARLEISDLILRGDLIRALAVGALIDVDDLPVELIRNYALTCAATEIRPLREIERQYILAALQRNGGNRTRTAQQLRIDDTTLLRKLKSYAQAS